MKGEAMTNDRGDSKSPDYLYQGSPAGTYAQNMHRREVSSNSVIIGATGIMTSVAIALQAGDIVTSITFRSGDTAASVPLNWGFALYSNASTPAKLAQTADQTTTAWAANTTKTIALATAQLITVAGIYYASLWMKATTQITCAGMILPHLDLSTGLLTTEKVISQSSGSALTTTAPATITTTTSLVGVPYVVVS